MIRNATDSRKYVLHASFLFPGIGCAQICTYAGDVHVDLSGDDILGQPVVESTQFDSSHKDPGVGGVSFWPDADLVRIADSGISIADVSQY